MLKFLLEKEFKQLLRGGMLPGILIMMPLMMMGLFPWAANMEMRNINVTVVDNDHSSYSSRLTGKVDASRYLHLESAAESYGAAMHRIERGSADLILEIPEHFERDITRDGMAPVMISANAVNGMKGSLGSIYASSVAMDFATEIAEENRAYATATDIPVVEVIPQNKFNPHMDYKVFMVPALMVMLLTMLCGFMPALNIVAEKEAGTIEQINVTPVGKFTFILAKLIPYWSIGFFVLTLCFGLARLFYGLAPAGSIVTIYAAAGLFVLTILGLRPHDFEPFRHDAAGDLRDDVFHGDPDSAQRSVHSNQQYAAVGAEYYDPQPPEIPDAGDAAGLPQRESLLTTYSTVRSAGHLRRCPEPVGGTELPEKFIIR